MGINITGQGETALRVYDLSGRLVDKIAEEVFPAEEQDVTWTPSPALALGCYLVRVLP